MKTTKRTDEALWERCKAATIHKMGTFSARAMPYTVQLYKKAGGGYVGPQSAAIALPV